MIVGASHDDDNGEDSGSAYLFDISDPSNPAQIAKLVAEDGSREDWFGRAVSISTQTVLVGTPRDDVIPGVSDSGSACLFDAPLVSSTGDFNGNGTVEQRDLDLVLNNWGGEVLPDFRGVAVPEPSVAWLILAASACLIRRRTPTL